jgi:hypothetical protein
VFFFRSIGLIHSQASRGLLRYAAAISLVFAAAVPAVRAQTASAPTGPTQAAPETELEELAAINAAAAMNDSGPEGIIPAVRGFNVSLSTTSQHDSANGWSSLLTPNAAYRLNKHFSLDAGVPIHTYINVDTNVGTATRPDFRYAVQGGVFGDTEISFEGDANTERTFYSGTFSLGLPSGNVNYGLGAGQVTYSINNHLETYFFRFTPDIELGFGDTSSLVEQRILKSYIAVGPMAHFQAGTAVDLPHSLTFEADAYEELPLAKNIVYSSTGKGKKKVTTSTNEDPGEDNGFITSLDIPLNPHLTLSGFYSRSLRDHNDVAGFSFTFLLKAPPRLTELER